MHLLIKFLTAAILTLALLSAGCTDTGGGSVDRPTPHKTAEPTQTGEPTATEKINHPYDINDPNIAYITIDSSENLFGIDIDDGYKFTNNVNGNYDYFNSDKNMIFQHTEHPHFDLYRELQPEQARALEDQYGYPESVVMEQADTDGDGALDKVAVRYEGSKGVLEFEMDIMKNANGRIVNVGPGSYILAHMYEF